MAIHVDVLLALHKRRLKRDLDDTVDDLDKMGQEAAEAFAKSFQSAEPKIRKSLNRVMDSTVDVVRKTKDLEKAEQARNTVAEKTVKVEKDLIDGKRRLADALEAEAELTDASTKAHREATEAAEKYEKAQKALSDRKDADHAVSEQQSEGLRKLRKEHSATTAAIAAAEQANQQRRLNGIKITKTMRQELLNLRKRGSREQKVIADAVIAQQRIDAAATEEQIKLEREVTEAKQKSADASAYITALDKQSGDVRKDLKSITSEIAAAERDLTNAKNEAAKADEDYLRRHDEMDKATRNRIEQLKTMREELIKQRDAERGPSLMDRFQNRSRGSARRSGDAIGSIMTEMPGVPGGPLGAVVGLGALGMMGNVAKAVVTATQALWLLPAAGAAGSAAIGTLALATHGFFDTLGDMGDAEKFAEGLAKLSPNAQQAALTIKALVDGPLGELQNAVQDTFFEGMDKELWKLADVFTNPIKELTTGIAGSFNDTFMGISNQLIQPGTFSELQNIFANVGSFFEQVEPVGASLTRAFTTIASVGSDFLPGLGTSIANAAEDFANWTSEVASNGDLRRWIEDGLAAFSELKDAIWEIGQYIYEVFAVDSVDDFKQGIRDAIDFVKLLIDAIGGLATILNDHSTAIKTVIAVWGTWKMANIVTDLGKIGAGLLGLGGFAKKGAKGIDDAFLPLLAPSGSLGQLAKILGVATTIGGSTLGGNAIANEISGEDRPWWWAPAMGATQPLAWMGYNPFGLRDDPAAPAPTGPGFTPPPSGPSIFGGDYSSNTSIGAGLNAPNTATPGGSFLGPGGIGAPPDLPSSGLGPHPGPFDVPVVPDDMSESEKKKAWMAAQDPNAYMPTLPSMPGLGYNSGSTFDWDAVAQAESSGRWDDNNSGGHNTSSGAPRGGLQITDGTWAAFGGNEFAPNAAMATREDQIKVAERIAFNGYNGTAPQGLGAWEAITKGMVPGITENSAPGLPTAGFSGGGVPGGTVLTEDLVKQIAGQFGLSVTSEDRPGDPGYHGRGMALDISNGSGNTPEMAAFAQYMNANFGGALKELIYSQPGMDANIKDGKAAPGTSVYDSDTLAGHQNHVHVAADWGNATGGGAGLPPLQYGNGGEPYAQNGYGYYDVDPRAVRDASEKVQEQAIDVRNANMELAYLEQNGGDAFEIEKARERATEEGRQYRDAVEDLAEKQQGTWKKLSKNANGFANDMQQIGAKIDDDFGISEGLPGIFENLFKVIANFAAAPVIGALTGVTQSLGTAGPGSGLLGALAPRDNGLLGPQPNVFGQYPAPPGYGQPQAPPTGPFGLPLPGATTTSSAPLPFSPAAGVGTPLPGPGVPPPGGPLPGPAPAGPGLGSFTPSGGPGMPPYAPIPGQRGEGFPTPMVPGASPISLQTGVAGTESRGIPHGQGVPASEGIGIGGGLIGAAQSMGGMGGGAGAVMSMGAQVGIDLINRTIGLGGQLAGNAVGGLMETFLPVESELADPSRGWFGRILGAVAGVKPAAENLAGGLTEKMAPEQQGGENAPPLTPQQVAAQEAAKKKGEGGGDRNVTNHISVIERENRNDYSVAKDMGYQAARATGN